MRPRSRLVVIVFAAAICFQSTATAQWLNYPTPGVPKAADGHPDLNAPAPKIRNGHPDLSGLWKPLNTMSTNNCFDPVGTFFDLGTGMKGGLPYQPWAVERVRKNRENNFEDQTDGKCLPLSPTQTDTHNDIRRLIQTPETIVKVCSKVSRYSDSKP
jgi:hypothetical protein